MNSQGAGHGGRIAEISGWDTEENFFVEKAVLQENGDGIKTDLRAQLRVGSLVFVRMIDETSMNRTVPVTYQVSGVSAPRGKEYRVDGMHETEIVRLRPKETTPSALVECTFRETMLN